MGSLRWPQAQACLPRVVLPLVLDCPQGLVRLGTVLWVLHPGEGGRGVGGRGIGGRGIGGRGIGGRVCNFSKSPGHTCKS